MTTEIVRYLQGYVWRRQFPRTKEEWDKQQEDRRTAAEINAELERVRSGEQTLEEAFGRALSHGDLRDWIRERGRDLIRPLPGSDDPRDWDYRYTSGQKLVRGTERWKP